MIDTRCALAPAGVPARGALDVRPVHGGPVPPARPRYAVVRTTPSDLIGTAVAAPAAPFQGTGVPAAGAVVARFGTTPAPMAAPFGGTALPIQLNSTTLGIHSPGRPTS